MAHMLMPLLLAEGVVPALHRLELLDDHFDGLLEAGRVGPVCGHRHHQGRGSLALAVDLHVPAAPAPDANLGAGCVSNLPHIAAAAANETRHQVEARQLHVEVDVGPESRPPRTTAPLQAAALCLVGLLCVQVQHAHLLLLNQPRSPRRTSAWETPSLRWQLPVRSLCGSSRATGAGTWETPNLRWQLQVRSLCACAACGSSRGIVRGSRSCGGQATARLEPHRESTSGAVGGRRRAVSAA
mmetsp:Transcript_54205/g.97673  ORF Transcript_54205/g.97673 Transcript_54205/m.97673 type:complete len:241 (+) Transcript_54205:517-1239(+)